MSKEAKNNIGNIITRLFGGVKKRKTDHNETTYPENSDKNEEESIVVKEVTEQPEENNQQPDKVEIPQENTEEKEEIIVQQDNDGTQIVAEWRANGGEGAKQNGTLIVFNKDERGKLITRHVRVIGLTGEVFDDVSLTMALSYCSKGYMPDKNTSSGYDKYKLFIRGTETPVFERPDSDKIESTHSETTEQQQAAAYVQDLIMKHQESQEVQPEVITPPVTPPTTNPVIPPVTNPVIPPVTPKKPATKRAKTSVDKTAYNGRDTDMYLTEPSYIPGVTKTSGNGLQAYVLDRATAEKSHVKSAFKNDRSFQLGGVYVLFNNNEVYYVGQQKPGSTTSRIINHTDTKRDNHTDWDNAVFVVSEDFNNDACDVFELLLISKLAPTDNNTKGNTGTAQAAYKKNTSYYNKKCEQILDIIAKAGIKLAVRTVDESKLQSKVLSDWFSGVTTTPELIASQMVEMIPEEKFYPDAKFLCFAAKDGIFASLLFDKLMQAPMFIKRFENKKARAAYIRENVLYIAFCSEIKKSYIPDIKDNLVKCVSDAHMIQLPDSVYLKTYDKNIAEQVCKTLSIEGDTTMQFDVVIGNPPYNKDMYLGFCENAFSLLKSDGVMVQITPAKFYGKGGQANEHFREVIMPHIDEVHLYKCCTDVFDIAEQGGVAYWRADKAHTFNTKEIYNHNKNAALDDTTEQLHTHTEQPVQFMPLKCLELIEKCKRIADGHTLFENLYVPGRYSYYCKNTASGHPKKLDTDLPLMSGVGGSLCAQGYLSLTELKTTDNIDKYKVIINEMMFNSVQLDKNNFASNTKLAQICKPGEVPKGSYVILNFTDTELAAQSFCSYINSMLTSFIAINICTTNKATSNENWRHIPALPESYKFDHVYTNEEIFDIFQLTPEERKLITSVIKERKQK